MNSPGTYPRRTGRSSAFTLIEIMVAFAIFGILVAAVYSTWTVILRSKQVGNEVAARIQRQRIALRTIEDSLVCVQSFQASLKYYSFIVQGGDQPTLSFVARLPAVFPRNGRFGDFNLRRLTFTVEAGPDSEKDLVLRQHPILMDIDSDEQNVPLVLARNVQEFAVECWDTNTTTWITEWDDTNSIPPILRVRLALNASNDPRDTAAAFTTTRLVSLPCMMMPSFLQVPNGFPGGGGVNFNPGGGSPGSGGQNPPPQMTPQSGSP